MNTIRRAHAGDTFHQCVRCLYYLLLFGTWTTLTVPKSVPQGARLLPSPHVTQRTKGLCIPAGGPILLSLHMSGLGDEGTDSILALPDYGNLGGAQV